MRETRGIVYKGVYIEAIHSDDHHSGDGWWVYLSLNSFNSVIQRDTPLKEIANLLAQGDHREFCHIRRVTEQSHDNPDAEWKQDHWWIRAGDDFHHEWDGKPYRYSPYTWEDMFSEGRCMVDALVENGVVNHGEDIND
jgi:hypothetical protein